MIASGHHYDTIMRYTWPQFHAFAAAVRRAESARQRDLFSLMLVASRGDQQAVDRVLAQLGAS